MTRAKDISKIITDADFSGTLDVTGAVTAGGLTVQDASAGRVLTGIFQNTTNAAGTSSGISLRNSANTTSVNLTAERVGSNAGADLVITGFDNAGVEKNFMRITEGNDISFYEDTGTTPKLFWDASTERLGIGTSSPSDILHIKDASSTNVLIDAPTDNASLTLQCGSSDAGAEGAFVNFIQNTTSKWQMGMNTDNSFRWYNYNTSSEAMQIDSSGNVGIGTSSPTAKVDLVDDGVQLRLANSTTGTTTSDGSRFQLSGNDLLLINRESANIQLYTADTERMRIDSSGNLLVGTTTNGTTADGTVIRASGEVLMTRTNAQPLLLNRAGNDGALIECRQANSIVGYIGANGGDLYVVNSGGVGAGLKYNSGYPNIIPCNGSGTNRDNAIDLGASGIRFDDIYATNGTIQTSDQQEKNTITDSDLGIDFIKRLSPKSYIFNGKTRTHYGLIAQDVETVLTDINKPTSGFAGFIKTDISEEQDGSEYKYGLRYTEFVAPLIQAVKDQQATIDALTARITALENGE